MRVRRCIIAIRMNNDTKVFKYSNNKYIIILVSSDRSALTAAALHGAT